MSEVVAGILTNNHRVLIARRGEHKSLAGKWEFPGGKVENGETHKQALKRELLEEFGVDLEIGEFVGSNAHEYLDFAVQLYAYAVSCPIQDLNSIDHDELRWVDKANILTCDLAAADVPLVSFL